MSSRAVVLLPLLLVLAGPPRAAAQSGGAQPDGSLEATGSTLLSPPPPVPPPGLMEADPRVRRATALLGRIEVLDTFSARLARQLDGLLGVEGPDCEASRAVLSGLDLTLSTSAVALATTRSGLDVLPPDPALSGLRDRTAQASARGRDSDRAGGALRARALAVCGGQRAAPTPWVPLADRTPVDGAVVLFVKTVGDQVAWVGPHPGGAPDARGWAAVVVPAGNAELCAGSARAERCASPVSVEAVALMAFDLSEMGSSAAR